MLNHQKSQRDNVLQFPVPGALTQLGRRNETVPFAQPIVSLETMNVIGLEFLARRRERETGQIQVPAQFLPALDKRELAVLDLEMANAVCQFGEALAERGAPPLQLHLNLSVETLQEQTVFEWLQFRLELYRGDPTQLTIEIVEAPGLDEPALARLRKISAQGFQLALDDFGAGYSNYARLLDCDFSGLKLDRSLVSRVVECARAQDIVASMLALGDKFELDVVAEGVETRTQARCLRELGCPRAQGFLWGLPQPLEVFQTSLKPIAEAAGDRQ